MDGVDSTDDQGVRRDLVDLPELLTLVGSAVGPLFADVGARALARPSAVAVDRALAPLTSQLRSLAGAVLDPGVAVGRGVDLERVLGRLANLGEGAGGIRRALARFETDARWVDGLYASLESLRQIAEPRLDDAIQRIPTITSDLAGRRFVLAATIMLSGRLPLGLDSADALRRHDETTLAIAVGAGALAGDPGARAVLRDTLAIESTSEEQVLSLIFGLGDGALVRGFETLVSLATRAIVEPARWHTGAVRAAISVSRGAVGEAVDITGADAANLCAPLIAVLCMVPEPEAGIAMLEALPDPIRRAVIERARGSLSSHPPPARAAIARQHLRESLVAGVRDVAETDEGGVTGEVEPSLTTDLLRERSPPVLLMILDIVSRLGDAIPPELSAALARALSDHPDNGVRKALATSLGAHHALAPAEVPSSAGVVALPPAALARDDLDRLRAALWTGESERIVELASCVPLDRRGAARESLLQSLEIPNAPLRRSIVDAIGRIGSHSDGPRLIDAAKRYRALEGTVAAALRELGARSVAEDLAEVYQRRLKWADDDAVDDYCAIAGPEQIAHLLHALETRYYPSARAGAARAIARRRASEVIFALRAAALSDTQDGARLAALGALHELTGSGPTGDELAGHALLFRSTEALSETVERAREAGPAALAGIRSTIARGSWKRRRAACDVLATLEAPEATEVLVEVLEDPDEDVRFAAIEALVQRGWKPSNAREHTLKALASRKVRELCLGPSSEVVDTTTLVGALSLGGHVFRAEVLEALNDLVAQVEFTPTPDQLAVIAAARMDVAGAVLAPGGVGAVLRAIDNTWQANPHRARFVRELRRLPSEVLADELAADESRENGQRSRRPALSWRAREAVAHALERDDDPVALEMLGRLVGEDDDDVRRASLQSLALVGSAAAAAEVARGLSSPFQEDRDLVARALGVFGRAAIDVIDELSVDAWWESRQGAALALGHWQRDLQEAVDRLVILAVDPEYRVAQAARDGLTRHSLMPTVAAICRALGSAQALMLEGLEPWLGLHRLSTAPPAIAHRLDTLIEETPVDSLPQRLGLIATFRAEHLTLWLKDVALGQGSVSDELSGHVGARLAAADALRALVRRTCTVCAGEARVRCPGCEGAGDVACSACQGRGRVWVTCPDPECTAHGTLRRIDSRRCATCRGRGEVPVPCTCEDAGGRVRCALCDGEKKLVCIACEGTGRVIT